jgi:endonuclease YncB( thermonuclease family)
MKAHLRTLLPGTLAVAAAAAFLVYGSLARPGNGPKIDQRRSTTLASGIISSVTDGDTIRLADNRRVRLVQIDAPELSGHECYAVRSWHTLEHLLPVGGIVLLRSDPRLDAKDSYGRILAYVLSAERNINLKLVQIGAAAPYFYRGDRGRYADELMTAARRARKAKRGLWGACPGTRLDPEHAVSTRR